MSQQPEWWAGTPVKYGQVKTLPQPVPCGSCKRPTSRVHVRDLTIFGREFRPVALGRTCARKWDAVEL